MGVFIENKTQDEIKNDIQKDQLDRLTTRNNVVENFHKYFYDSKFSWGNTRWAGTPVLKCPLDLWVYQEVLFQLKPELIIETGTAWGGSALFLSHLCDINKIGKVITIDLNSDDYPNRPTHDRLLYIKSDSIDPNLIIELDKICMTFNSVMVILDSDHTSSHVYQELNLYSKLVTVGQYLVVEDTNLGTLVRQSEGKDIGPKSAIDQFLIENNNFQNDIICERYLMSFNSGGWIKRLK